MWKATKIVAKETEEQIDYLPYSKPKKIFGIRTGKNWDVISTPLIPAGSLVHGILKSGITPPTRLLNKALKIRKLLKKKKP